MTSNGCSCSIRKFSFYFFNTVTDDLSIEIRAAYSGNFHCYGVHHDYSILMQLIIKFAFRGMGQLKYSGVLVRKHCHRCSVKLEEVD